MVNKDTPDLMYFKNKNPCDYDGPFLFIYNTDFHYYPFGEIYQDLTGTREFGRLNGIKQIGTVGFSCLNACQDQSREFHSFVAAGMMDIVLYRNNFTDHERKLGVAAGLYHDIATVPFSEQGKLLKPGAYEEETLVEYLIKKSPEIKQRLKKHNIGIDEVVDTIQGNGKVGKLINSKKGIDTDNLSYLAIDHTWMCSASDDERISLEKEKGIFDQYNNIKYIDNKWVFDNPALLTKLLKFRALMYKNTYVNPSNRAKEAFLKSTLNGHHIELDDLLSWRDVDFERWFEKTMGYKDFRLFFTIAKDSFIEIGREYDLTKLKQLKKERKDAIVEHLKPPRDATENLVLHDSKVVLLEEIPEFSGEIHEIKDIIKGLNYIGIYKLDNNKN